VFWHHRGSIQEKRGISPQWLVVSLRGWFWSQPDPCTQTNTENCTSLVTMRYLITASARSSSTGTTSPWTATESKSASPHLILHEAQRHRKRRDEEACHRGSKPIERAHQELSRRGQLRRRDSLCATLKARPSPTRAPSGRRAVFSSRRTSKRMPTTTVYPTWV
jgi:hypothetical protein